MVSKISGLVIMVLFLTVGVAYAQPVEEYCVKGVEYGTQGKFEEAEKEFKKALEVDQFYASAKENLTLIKDVLEKRVENEVAIHLFKGITYDSKGMLDESIGEYEKAVALNPNYAMAHNNLGVAYYYKGMLDEAIAEYEKAIAINPNHANAHSNLGLAYAKGKRMFDEAIAECKKAIAINPNHANAHSNLGLAYVGKKMLDEGIAEYRKAIAIDPNLAVAYNNLAVAYYLKKEYGLAIEHCDRAIELGYEVHPGFLNDLKPYRK
jgi:tetratricopeptide (TPR) repeat protein